jgi:hypothetical protein
LPIKPAPIRPTFNFFIFASLNLSFGATSGF